jgi:alpha-1,6-mannosyltransferase
VSVGAWLPNQNAAFSVTISDTSALGGPPPTAGAAGRRRILGLWALLAVTLVGLSTALAWVSPWFGNETELLDQPVPLVSLAMVLVGLAFLAILPLLRASLRAGLGGDPHLIWLIAGTGVMMRLALFGSTPILEDDYYRYLWDGGVTAAGYSPYGATPDAAQGEQYHYSLQPLARQSGTVIEGVNHSDLKTIYPPVAQAAFAVAHWVQPWSLTAWRGVCLAAELATFALLLMLLRDVGRPALWASLYWLNPLMAKELINSAHMDVVVTPLVLAAFLMSLRRRPAVTALALGLAIGAKIWPLILVPLVFRPWLSEPKKLVLPGLILTGLCLAVAWPMISGGLDASSGLTAYATHWRNSSGLYVVIQKSLMAVLAPFDVSKETIGALIRMILVGAAAGVMVLIVRRPLVSHADMMARAALLTAALVLLSPSQFPWYAAWTLPFAVFRPSLGIMLMTALMPVYYVGFYFSEREIYQVYREGVVFVIWLPVWATLAYEAWRESAGLAPIFDGSADAGQGPADA